MRRRASLGFVLLGCLLGACRPAATQSPAGAESSAHLAAEPARKPSSLRLVLWITVDQLRPDFLERFADRLSPGGFSRLLEQGASYANAHYAHALTETAPGHATLFTGASPAEHGIVSNSWVDRRSGAVVQSVGDAEAPLVGAGANDDTGRSPRKLLLPTLGDALTAATDGRAKVLSVSTKDRAAILPGGWSGRAFWLGPRGFLTSRYYLDELPDWVEAHNARHPVQSYQGSSWELLEPPERYQRITEDDRASERPAYGLGRTFPHPIAGDDQTLARAVAATPFGDELTVSFALSALEAEGLGSDDVPDLLAVSLSSTDMVGHAFGPESLEAEDNFVRLDRQLKRLFEGVEARVGLNRTLIVLSADHGGSETAEHLAELGLDGARLEPTDLLETAQETAAQAFGDPKLVLGFTNPTLWIDHGRAHTRKLDPAFIATVLAEALTARPEVYRAFPTAALLALPATQSVDGGLVERIRRSLHPERSGDVYIVPRPHALLLQGSGIAATHGSPWQYDTRVPLLLLGPGVRSGVQERLAAPHQLAATVARLLGITAPAGSQRAPLLDVLTEGTAN